MTSSSVRLWLGVAAVVVASVLGDAVCKAVATGGGRQQKLDAAAVAVERFPKVIGRWRLVESTPLGEDALAMLMCRAHTSSIYTHEETGESVSVVLLAGIAGPLVAHTPEVCYSSTQFEILESPQPQTIRSSGAQSDTFDRVLFRDSSVAGRRQIVYYGWRPYAGHWTAPKWPRLALGGEPMLYKLQVASGDVDSAEGASDEKKSADPCRRFLGDLLPALDEALFRR